MGEHPEGIAVTLLSINPTTSSPIFQISEFVIVATSQPRKTEEAFHKAVGVSQWVPQLCCCHEREARAAVSGSPSQVPSVHLRDFLSVSAPS